MQTLRYVILLHLLGDESHYDLMFETLPGSMLSTWRSQQWPIEQYAELTRLRDHRRLYLDYEGPIAARGDVQRVTDGECEVEVGENSVWTIKLLSGSAPTTLVLRPLADQQWQVEAK